jgi:hypothetical protein
VSLGSSAYSPSRPSASERDQVIDALRQSHEAERLSLDTFSARVELALSAKTDAQLADLLTDLPQHHPFARFILAVVSSVSWWTARLGLAWREARIPLLALPTEESVTLGRSRNCDWVVADPTVSRRHALLRHDNCVWRLCDLGSSNGTFLNGWRVLNEVEVRPGDRLTLGQVDYRLTRVSVRESLQRTRPRHV